MILTVNFFRWRCSSILYSKFKNLLIFFFIKVCSMLSWRILSPSSSPTMYCLSTTHTLSCTTITPSRDPTASLRLPETSMDEPLKSESKPKPNSDVIESTSKKTKKDVAPGDQDQEGDEQISISRIQVPRQKYISVSKAELLDAIVSVMFHSQDDRDQFLLIASCLDSILHAEHKSILEEMRNDYFFTDSAGDEGSISSDTKLENNGKENKSVHVFNTENSDPDSDIINRNGRINKYVDDEGEETEPNELSPFNYGLDLWNLIGSAAKNVEKYNESRLAVSTRFQRAFMQLLNSAQFEELSATDLVLTSALNTDYLLTLPVYVDWKRASESNAIIFRRGYATERQKGLLIVEKLDYIQSRLLQKIFFIISKPLEKVGKWISETLTNASQTQEVQDIIKRTKLWLKELSFFQQSYFSNEETSDSLLDADQLSDGELPIWLAAQKAVSRYEGFLSPVGPRGRLLRKLLTNIGFTSPTPETTFQLEANSNASEPYLRPISLSRISLSDIWRPASRKYCGNDLWKMLKTSVSILLSKSILQEPAFEELVLLYTNDMDKKETKDKAEGPPLQLKIYRRIPIPDLPVIFPHKKLSFRIIDTVRLDVATIVGLLAFIINYKFEDILSSPSALLLDVIAISALILYITRVVLGYKQTRDRYELLVNKTLYEKTLASGFGSIHFLLDASEQQQYKEAILTYAILLKEESCQLQGTCRQIVGDKCEKFMYDVLKEKVEMPIDKAVNLLVRLGMVSETSIDGRSHLQATPCSEACEALKERWNGLLG
ncbi:uncharacterized protein LOC116108987 isoform X3 [Pistacia vera]|uniref:uncharacterized protein LOC116108987 isoform X3 n=1 Tax=Pistacia vera TaxID=55513 RepID=UPI001262FE9B|nr:uncharacterized protein LOC116108987 isoform X3 [Pistacia vera]